MRIAYVLILLALSLSTRAQDMEAASLVLDRFHTAAARSDFDGYFSLFARGAFFLGTDASERWSVEEFKAYAKTAFDAGRGWHYEKQERNIIIAADGQTGWFDEVLFNARLGRCRGTGVLVKQEGAWKITFYSLTLLIPNNIAATVGAQTIAEDSTSRAGPE